MKILALEQEVPGIKESEFKKHAKAEAKQACELYQSGKIRELYFQKEKSCAVLILECQDADEAREILNTLPLVKNGLITFDIIPLIPYPGFSRLFSQET